MAARSSAAGYWPCTSSVLRRHPQPRHAPACPKLLHADEHAPCQHHTCASLQGLAASKLPPADRPATSNEAVRAGNRIQVSPTGLPALGSLRRWYPPASTLRASVPSERSEAGFVRGPNSTEITRRPTPSDLRDASPKAAAILIMKDLLKRPSAFPSGSMYQDLSATS